MAVPLFDTRTALEPLRAELDAAVGGVLERAAFILGPETEAFEAEFASYIGSDEAIGVANGTEAITIALRALGVGPGDEVVVPSFTFFASAEAIPPTGATAVFCDIDPETFCVTAQTVKAAITPKTKAVIAVHLFGNIAPVEEIEALGVPVIEDAAQAAGSHGQWGRPGALGTLATFSFYPSKNLGCFGDGGAITTSDPALARRVRSLRFHGSQDKITHEEVGYNSRLDEIQAAVLRVQLSHLDGWAQRRHEAGEWYRELLGDAVTHPLPAPGSKPAWHIYVVRHKRADELLEALTSKGIGARAYYRVPSHAQPAFGLDLDLPGTATAAREHLALPISATITREQVSEVAGVVRAAGLGSGAS